MYKAKTTETDESVIEFIETVEHQTRKEDAYRLLSLFEEVTGLKAKMWGPSIIGFGKYHYKYESGHEGDAMLAGFSPRKANISLYLYQAFPEREEMLSRLGKHKAGKGCVYINKTADIDADVLKEMIRQSVDFLNKKYSS